MVDGEIVALEGSRTSFARLQQRIGIHYPHKARASRVAVTFDVPPLVERDWWNAI